MFFLFEFPCVLIINQIKYFFSFLSISLLRRKEEVSKRGLKVFLKK